MKLRRRKNINILREPQSEGRCKFCHRRHKGFSKTGKNAGDGCQTWSVRRYVPTSRTHHTVVPPDVRKAVSAQETAIRLGTAHTPTQEG